MMKEFNETFSLDKHVNFAHYKSAILFNKHGLGQSDNSGIKSLALGAFKVFYGQPGIPFFKDQEYKIKICDCDYECDTFKQKANEDPNNQLDYSLLDYNN